MRVLIVDDEPNILNIVEAYLVANQYEVFRAESGKEALQKFSELQPDLLILDLMLPDLSGIEVCKQIRKYSSVPIIMLTARSSESDILTGLHIGADDYISKPFSPKELVARVETVLRRVQPIKKDSRLSFYEGELEIFPESRQVFLKGKEIECTTSEYNLLEFLARHPNQVFSRDQLLENSKGWGYESTDRAIDSHIKNIRQKLEDTPRQPKYIKTVYGIGYRFGGSE